jgi:diphthine-ammonia ligase
MNKLKTAILFSGGKDSCLALEYAVMHTDVKCLIVMISENDESYMFHIPNIRWAEKQAEAIGIPVIIQKTRGMKEEELKDLEKAIRSAIKKYKIDGVVSGAIESVYQASRIQKIATKWDIECFNPLWQKDQIGLLNELVQKKYEVIIVGTFGDGLQDFIGRKIDKRFIEDVKKARDKYHINPAGEGGEFESFVLYAPYWKKRLEVRKSHIVKEKSGGRILIIDDLEI